MSGIFIYVTPSLKTELLFDLMYVSKNYTKTFQFHVPRQFKNTGPEHHLILSALPRSTSNQQNQLLHFQF